MSQEMWSDLRSFADGDPLDAKTLNVPIGQLGERTSYLYSRINEFIESGKMSAVIFNDVALATEDGASPYVGNVVYLRDDGKFASARAAMDLYDDFKASDSAFTVGILSSRTGDKGNVVMAGSFLMQSGGAGIDESDVIESGEEFRPGRYYLSSQEPGKLTKNPSGPVVYVCTISGSVVSGSFSEESRAIVGPQFLDIGTSHVHRSAVMTARPSGSRTTAGYLPTDASVGEGSNGPLALRFGGRWTSGNMHVNYTFYLDQDNANWPNGVTLRWKVDGKSSDEYKVQIHAPDEEVNISNGLTARLSLPDSDQTKAYSDLIEGRRTWDTLTFPDAGAGWLDHEPMSSMSSGDVSFDVVGKTGEIDTEVSVAIVDRLQTCSIVGVESGDTFTYGSSTYVFMDVDDAEGNVIQLGTCVAESAMHLAKALSAAHSDALFAVFEYDSGDSADLLVLGEGASDVAKNTGIVGAVSIEHGNDVNVPCGLDDVHSSTKVVVFNGEHRVMSESRSVDVVPYVRTRSGDISLMMYTKSGKDITAKAGTVMSADMHDDEPGAIYDYVIGLDTAMAAYWPPVPAKSASLVVNGVEMDNKALFPERPTVSFGRDTVHWFTGDKGRKPWPESMTTRDGDVDPSEDKTMVMHWVRGFQGATGPVTSLQAREGSPIKIYGYGTSGSANTGDLEIDADFEFDIRYSGEPGFNVPKRAINGSLYAGPVVEKIVGGAGVRIMTSPGCPDGQGTVTVALDNGSYRDKFSDIALENAEQAKIGMFPYIRLRGYTGSSITSPSAFTATMRVPTNIPDGNYSLAIYASVFGESGFTGASVKSASVRFSYNILPDFSSFDGLMYRSLKSSLLVPNAERIVTIPFGHEGDDGIVYNGFDPVFLMTDASSVENADDVVYKGLGSRIPAESEFAGQMVIPGLRPGYFVGIRMARAVSSSASEPYTSGIGFMNLTWELFDAEREDSGTTSSKDSDLEQIRDELKNKIDKDVMSGTHISTGTIPAMRDSIEKIGNALGASVASKK